VPLVLEITAPFKPRTTASGWRKSAPPFRKKEITAAARLKLQAGIDPRASYLADRHDGRAAHRGEFDLRDKEIVCALDLKFHEVNEREIHSRAGAHGVLREIRQIEAGVTGKASHFKTLRHAADRPRQGESQNSKEQQTFRDLDCDSHVSNLRTQRQAEAGGEVRTIRYGNITRGPAGDGFRWLCLFVRNKLSCRNLPSFFLHQTW
jgi:hypothetical protein